MSCVGSHSFIKTFIRTFQNRIKNKNRIVSQHQTKRKKRMGRKLIKLHSKVKLESKLFD